MICAAEVDDAEAVKSRDVPVVPATEQARRKGRTTGKRRPGRQATRPLVPAYHDPEGRHLTEEEVVDRLERLQQTLGLPASLMAVLLETLCPEAATEPPLPEPTAALPGTPERLRVLEERAARGEALWHPADADWNADGQLHLEQAGQLIRNGSINRMGCPVRPRNGVQSVVDVGQDPEEAAEALRRHFKGADLEHLAGLLWEGLGWRGHRSRPAPPPAPPAPPARKRRRKQPDPSQLLLWAE